jgi:hypothetical protein
MQLLPQLLEVGRVHWIWAYRAFLSTEHDLELSEKTRCVLPVVRYRGCVSCLGREGNIKWLGYGLFALSLAAFVSTVSSESRKAGAPHYNAGACLGSNVVAKNTLLRRWTVFPCEGGLRSEGSTPSIMYLTRASLLIVVEPCYIPCKNAAQ